MSGRAELDLERHVPVGQVAVANRHPGFHLDRRTVHFGLGIDLKAAGFGRVPDKGTRNTNVFGVEFRDGAGEELRARKSRLRRIGGLCKSRQYSAHGNRNC